MLERSAQCRDFADERTDETCINRRKPRQRKDNRNHRRHACGIGQMIAVLGVFRTGLRFVAAMILCAATVRVVSVLVLYGERDILVAKEIMQTARLQRRSQSKQQRGYHVQQHHARDYTFIKREYAQKTPPHTKTVIQ